MISCCERGGDEKKEKKKKSNLKKKKNKISPTIKCEHGGVRERRRKVQKMLHGKVRIHDFYE